MPAAKPPEFRRRALDLVAQGEPVAAVAGIWGSASRVFAAGWIKTMWILVARKG